MNLPETGVLDLNWTIDSSFSGYKVEIYRDEEQVSQSLIEPNTINSLSFTGFAEGNSGRAEVFGYQKFRGHKIYSPTGLYSNSTFFFLKTLTLLAVILFILQVLKLTTLLWIQLYIQETFMKLMHLTNYPTHPMMV